MKTDFVLNHNFKELLLSFYDGSAIEFEINNKVIIRNLILLKILKYLHII